MSKINENSKYNFNSKKLKKAIAIKQSFEDEGASFEEIKIMRNNKKSEFKTKY